MNVYRWGLVIIASIIGIGNIWLLDFADLSLSNNIFEYMGIITMFGISFLLSSHGFQKKEDENSIS